MRQAGKKGELSRSRLCGIVSWAYRWRPLRGISVAIITRLEQGEFYSATLRRILQDYHGVRAALIAMGNA